MRRRVSMRGGRRRRWSRAIADWVVPTISASSRCDSPISCLRSATLSAIAAKNQPRSAVRMRSCNRSSGLFAARAIYQSCYALVVLRAEALVEEPAEQEHCTDGEERERALRGAEAGQVEEEDLAETDAEEN